MLISDKNRVALTKLKNIDDAAQYTAMHMGIDDEAEVIKLMLLSRHCNYQSGMQFAQAIAEIAPVKLHSIDINQSRFERFIKSANSNEFVTNFAECLRTINYQCSQSSVTDLVDKFINRLEFPRSNRERWYFDIYMLFVKQQRHQIDD